MAISYINGNSGVALNGGNVTISLGLMGIAENDIVCVFGGFPSSGTAQVTSPGGYTLDTNYTANGITCGFSYKVQGASPDTSLTLSGDGDTTHGVAYIVMVFRGVDTSTPIDATTITASGTDAAGPNSGSITTVTNGAAVISFGASNNDELIVTQPSGYSSSAKENANRSETVPFCVAGSAKAIVTAGAENPGSWSSWTTTVWNALTVALRPAGAGSFGDGALSATGTATASFEDGTLKVLAATGTITASFTGAPFVDALLGMTGAGTATFEGTSLATSGAFSATGAVTASFVGGLAGSGSLSVSGTATATFDGASIYSAQSSFTASVSAVFVADDVTLFISHVREEIESRGAATVSIG